MYVIYAKIGWVDKNKSKAACKFLKAGFPTFWAVVMPIFTGIAQERDEEQHEGEQEEGS